MSNFLIFLVLILGVVAIIQLANVYTLSAQLRGKKEEDFSEHDNKTNAILMLLFPIVFFMGYVWILVNYSHAMLPESASIHGAATDLLMDFNYIIVNIVFIVVNSLLFFFAYKYAFNKNRKSEYFTHSQKLEMIWTIVPSLVLAVIIAWGLKTWNEVIMQPASEDAIVIGIYSKQFDWTARYAGTDNLLGKINIHNIEGANFLGMDDKDEKGFDDVIVKGEFHIPVNKEVNFIFNSQDVIHSAFIPHFRLQMNTVPGMTTNFHMTPTITTAEMRVKENNPEFNYILMCNKVCGASHYNMQMDIIVESEEDYNKWLDEQKVYNEDGLASIQEKTNKNLALLK